MQRTVPTQHNEAPALLGSRDAIASPARKIELNQLLSHMVRIRNRLGIKGLPKSEEYVRHPCSLIGKERHAS